MDILSSKTPVRRFLDFVLAFALALLFGSLIYAMRQRLIGLQPNFQALVPYVATVLFMHFWCFLFLVIRPRHLIENTVVVTLLALSTATVFVVVFSFVLRQTYSLFLMMPFTMFLWIWVLINENLRRTQLTRLRYILIDLGQWRGAVFPNIHLSRIRKLSELDDDQFDILLVDSNVKEHSDWKDYFSKFSQTRKPQVDARQFYEVVSGKVWPTTFFPDDLRADKAYFYRFFLKRFLDITIAFIALVVMLPVFCILALIVFFSSPGGVLFRQQRVGMNGETFVLYKIRTMYIDSEVDGPQFTVHRDQRITPIGRFLRRSRLDEWPQFLNVLRGEMSIIGPRPERPEWVDDFKRQIPFYDARHVVRPGITGWAQVQAGYGVGKSGAETKLNFDLYYIRYIGIAIDVMVLFRTLATLVGGSGAR